MSSPLPERPPHLYSPKDAIGHYLEDLFEESRPLPPRPLEPPRPTGLRSPVSRPQTQRQPALVPAETRTAPTTELLVQPLLRALETRPPPQAEIKTQVETRIQTQTQGPPSPPDWASGRFPVLFFDVAERRFALPLVLLHSVGKRAKNIVQLPGQPFWSMGVFIHRGDKVTLVDTATLLMPNRTGLRDNLTNRYVLRLGSGRWALACDALGQVQKLTLDDIRWHRHPGRDRFIAGVVTKQLRMILDIEAILRAVGGK